MNNALKGMARGAILAVSIILTFTLFYNVDHRALAWDDEESGPCLFPYSGGSSLLNIPYKNSPDSPPYGDYLTAFNSARNDWYNTATPVVFVLRNDLPHWLEAREFPEGDSALERASWDCGGGTRNWTFIALNTAELHFYGTSVKRSTANHELGHHIVLAHSSFDPDPVRTRTTS